MKRTATRKTRPPSPKKKKRLAQIAVDALTGFADAIDAKEIKQRLPVHTIPLTLSPRSYTSANVQQTRRLLGASQARFASFLGVSVKTVAAWEQGVNSPSMIARRFMDEIWHSPNYWLRRLRVAQSIAGNSRNGT
jgi:putative transcriptional regulator